MRYLRLDVLSDAFVDALRCRVAALPASTPCYLVGMHLCGELSLRAIRAFREIPCAGGGGLSPETAIGQQSSAWLARYSDVLCRRRRMAALVLAPCCLPNVRIAEDTPPNVFESKEQSIQYERWCAFLKQRMEQAAASAQCLECESDQEKGLVSEKNVLLTAVRRRVAGEDGIEVE